MVTSNEQRDKMIDLWSCGYSDILKYTGNCCCWCYYCGCLVFSFSWCVSVPATSHTHTHTHTTVLRLSGLRPGQPGWAGTRRNIHPLTPIMVISHSFSASSIYYDPWHPPCSIYVPDSLFHNFSPSFLCSTFWPGTLNFILHTFLHPMIDFFSQYMPIPSQPVLL